MSRSRAGRAALSGPVLLVLLAAHPAGADPRIEVSGDVQSVGQFFEVRLDLANRGDALAAAVHVSAELLGRQDTASLESGVRPGAVRSVLLRYPAEVPRPGLHPLLLLIEYTLPSGVAASQRAYLLLALGARPDPALRLAVAESTLRDMGSLPVVLASADGKAHRARLRVLTPKGLRADPPRHEIEVPAHGETRALVTLYRGAAPWGTPQGILVVASASDGPLERTAVAIGLVRIAPDPALIPRLRRTLLVLAVLLLVSAAAAEALRLRR